MTDSEKANILQEEEVLKPFYARASQAEERLSRLEAAISTKNDTGNEEFSKTISELQSKIEDMKLDHVSDKNKASLEIQRLQTENAKLQYRILHLLRALEDADSKRDS
ncbi:threonine-tRNA ligase [Thalictrum thalictroides]|uniref:Threonine-tRNA ligase n=1 Tax=Thalictrum thalictroides TaxID=46969 RepID=A0A7J6WH96_THATH|nr:threonine-tRNA ligase [Thalictrum thalictroides]